MYFNFWLIFCVLFSFISVAFGQVGIGTDTPNAASILELSSATQGFLPPRLDRSVLSLTAAEEGMVVYDTNDGAFFYWDGAAWQELANANIASPFVKSGSNVYPAVVTDYVGIGTAFPVNHLHVNDPANSQGGLRLTAGTVTGVSTTDGVSLNINGAGASLLSYETTPFYFGVGGVNVLTLTGTGLGVGVSPTAALDVNGAVLFRGALNMNTANKIINLANPTNAQDAATKFYVDAAANGANFILNQNAAPQTAQFYINGSGKVGGTLSVGTTSVAETLTVAGGVMLTNAAARSVYVENETTNAADGKALSLRAGSAATGAQARAGGNVLIAGGQAYNISINGADGGDIILRSGGNLTSGIDNGGDIIFELGGANNTVTEAMRLEEGGNLGIGTPTPDDKAILDVSATNKGVLFPRMTEAQRNAIAAPPNGLHIFNTETGSLEVYNSTFGQWVSYIPGGTAEARIYRITSNVNGFNLFTTLGSPTSPVLVTVIVEPGVTVGASGSGGTGFNTGLLPAGSKVRLINKGTIAGGGGNGGNGANLTTLAVCLDLNSETAGSAGGHAIETRVPIIIENYGTIAGGGGGGGGGGATTLTTTGGGGGGGAGIPAGAGGAGGVTTGGCIAPQCGAGINGNATTGGNGNFCNGGANSGGNGGNRALAGTNGAATGAPGGAAGNRVKHYGNSVTFAVTGTTFGADAP